MIKLTASNLVSMILFIPLIFVLGLILAFVVPVLAIIFAALGILLTTVYVCSRIMFGGEKIKKEGNDIGKKGLIEIKHYKIR